MPDEIREAIHAARGDQTGSIQDEEYRKRLQDRFGSRWTMKVLVPPSQKMLKMQPASPDVGTVEVSEEVQPVKPWTPHKRRKTFKVLLPKMQPGGSADGVEREVPVDVPKYRFAGKDDFELDWHLAAWLPTDPDGPTVQLNQDSPILTEVIKYHQDQYPDVYAEEVADTVRQVFGEVAACKIAHSQKLVKKVAVETLDADYRNERALTIALMGLLAEESLISQRLGRFGKKKAA
ncbi:MAG TPA: hypothetical protein VLV86_00470 [Vicinamibacterales bacterium]|nr:hypothetical protein [Vicinamibacterales bacterium]